MSFYEVCLLVSLSVYVCVCVCGGGEWVSIVSASWLVPTCGKAQGCAGFGSQPQSSDSSKIQSIQEDTHEEKRKSELCVYVCVDVNANSQSHKKSPTCTPGVIKLKFRYSLTHTDTHTEMGKTTRQTHTYTHIMTVHHYLHPFTPCIPPPPSLLSFPQRTSS